MNTLRSLVLHLLLLLGAPAWAEELFTTIRVSVKVILGAAGADPRGDRGASLASIFEGIERGNRTLAYTDRNVRLDLVEVVELQGLEAGILATSPLSNRCTDLRRGLNELVAGDPDRYAFRADAVNIYYLDCSGPNVSARTFGNLILMRPRFRTATLFHELGHWFKLKHTFQGQEMDPTQCSTVPERARQFLEPGDDDIPDTFPDHSCWHRDNLAVSIYGLPYSMLQPAATRLLLNTYENFMTYHNNPLNTDVGADERDRMTHLQLTHILHHAASLREPVTREEMHRAGRASGGLGQAEEALQREALLDSLLGRWVAPVANMWVSEVSFARHPMTNLVQANVLSRHQPDWIGQGVFADLYGDTVAVVPWTNFPLGVTDFTLTYTFRPTEAGELKVRVAEFRNGASAPLVIHEVLMERPSWTSSRGI